MMPDMRWGNEFREFAELKGWGNGSGINVAIIDTGIDPHHSDLRGDLLWCDFTSEGIQDTHGHGTAGAGIVGGRGQNNGFLGMAPKCKLLVAKVGNNPGQFSQDNLQSAFEWVEFMDSDIVVFAQFISPEIQSFILEKAEKFDGSGRILVTGSIACEERDPKECKANKNWAMVGNTGYIGVETPLGRIWSTYRNGAYAQLSCETMSVFQVAGLLACKRSADSLGSMLESGGGDSFNDFISYRESSEWGGYSLHLPSFSFFSNSQT